MSRRLIYVVLFISLMTLASNTFAQNYGVKVNDAVPRLEALKAANSQIMSISADFTMVKKVKLLNDLQNGYGKMSFDKTSDRLSLVFTDPKDNAILFAGDKLTMTTDGKTTTMTTQQNPAMSQMMSMIKACVTGDFSSLTDKSEVACYADDTLFTVVINPRNARVKRFVKQIALSFNADNSLNMMRMDEGSGDYTVYTYSNQVIQRR